MLIPNLNDIPELAPVPAGNYDLRISRAKEISSRNTGRKGIFLACEIIGEDNAEDLIHTIWLPMEGDESTKANNMLRMLKEFMIALGLPTDEECGAEVFQDVEFEAVLELVHDDYAGKEINKIKRVL